MYHKKGDKIQTHEEFIILSTKFAHPKYWWNKEHEYCCVCGECRISKKSMVKLKDDHLQVHLTSLFSLPQFKHSFGDPDKDHYRNAYSCSFCRRNERKTDEARECTKEDLLISLFHGQNGISMDWNQKKRKFNHLEEKEYQKHIKKFFKDMEVNDYSLNNNAIALKTSAAILYNVCVGSTGIYHRCLKMRKNQENWLQSLLLSCENSDLAQREEVSNEEYDIILESWVLLSTAAPTISPNNKCQYWNLQFYTKLFFKIRESYIYSLNMTELHPGIRYFQHIFPKLNPESGDDELSFAFKILERPFLQSSFPPTNNQSNNNDTTDIPIDLKQQKQFRARYASRLSQLATESVHKGTISDNGENIRMKNPFFTFAQSGTFFCPSLASISHSCLPNCAVQLFSGNKKFTDENQNLTSGPIRIGLLALYSFHTADELPTVNRLNDPKLSYSQRQDALKKLFRDLHFTCSCLLCRYESSQNADFTPHELQRLGDWYMQNPDSFSQQVQDNSKLALSLYLRALHKLQETQIKHHTKEIRKIYASLAYAHGAWHLERGEFVRAQKVWKDYFSDCKFSQHDNKEIKLQVQKNLAYNSTQSEYNNRNDGNNDFDYVIIAADICKSYECIVSQKLYITTQPILSKEQCNRIIDWAESHSSGWTTSRHHSVPTTDIPVHDIPMLLSWFRDEFMTKKLLPLLENQFDIVSANNLYIHDAFVVKYSCNENGKGQTYLPWHTDQSTLSFIITLNDNFDGGGTYFECLGKSIRPEEGCGHIVSFRGDNLVHGGDPITSGKRYILVAFCYVDNTTLEQIHQMQQSDVNIEPSCCKSLINQFSNANKTKKHIQEHSIEHSHQPKNEENENCFVFKFNL